MKLFLPKSTASIFSTEPAWLGDIRTETQFQLKNLSCGFRQKTVVTIFFWKNSRTIQGPPIDSTKIPD